MGSTYSFVGLFNRFMQDGQNVHRSNAASKHKTMKASLLGIIAVMLLAFVGFSFNAKTEAAAVINYNATEVRMPGGKTIISGYFVNSGNADALVTYVELSVDITDSYGNYIWNDNSNFSNVGAYVPAGGSVRHTFTIWNNNAPQNNSLIKWNVNTHMYWKS